MENRRSYRRQNSRVHVRKKSNIYFSRSPGYTMCAHAQTSCPLSSLSSAGLPSPMAVSLDQLKVTIKPETSRVDVRITNRDRRPINAMFMLVDFQVSGRYQLSTIFYLLLFYPVPATTTGRRARNERWNVLTKGVLQSSRLCLRAESLLTTGCLLGGLILLF
jgi:hypothetical protein